MAKQYKKPPIIEKSKRRLMPMDDKICQMEKIILSIFPHCEIKVIRKENEYRSYLEFRIRIKEVENYQKLADKFVELHKITYLQIKEPEFEYSFDITQLNFRMGEKWDNTRI